MVEYVAIAYCAYMVITISKEYLKPRKINGVSLTNHFVYDCFSNDTNKIKKKVKAFLNHWESKSQDCYLEVVCPPLPGEFNHTIKTQITKENIEYIYKAIEHHDWTLIPTWIEPPNCNCMFQTLSSVKDVDMDKIKHLDYAVKTMHRILTFNYGLDAENWRQ